MNGGRSIVKAYPSGVLGPTLVFKGVRGFQSFVLLRMFQISLVSFDYALTWVFYSELLSIITLALIYVLNFIQMQNCINNIKTIGVNTKYIQLSDRSGGLLLQGVCLVNNYPIDK